MVIFFLQNQKHQTHSITLISPLHTFYLCFCLQLVNYLKISSFNNRQAKTLRATKQYIYLDILALRHTVFMDRCCSQIFFHALNSRTNSKRERQGHFRWQWQWKTGLLFAYFLAQHLTPWQKRRVDHNAQVQPADWMDNPRIPGKAYPGLSGLWSVRLYFMYLHFPFPHLKRSVSLGFDFFCLHWVVHTLLGVYWK